MRESKLLCRNDLARFGGVPKLTECSAGLFGLAPVAGRRVEAALDGARLTTEAGALLLGATDRAIGLVGRLAGCFADACRAELVEHAVAMLIGQRVFGIALGAACPRAGEAGPGGGPERPREAAPSQFR